MNRSIRYLSALLAAIFLMSTFALSANADPSYDPYELPIVGPGSDTAAITSVENTVNGAMIRWNACNGADRYALYTHDDDAYALLTVTDGLSWTHTDVASGTTVAYNIKALSGDQAISDFAPQDTVNTFFAAPRLESVSSTAEGVALRWSDDDAVDAYMVYRLSGAEEFTALAVTDGPSYTDTTAVSGTCYSYAVRCYDPINDSLLSAYSSARSINYVKTPSITSFSNTATGTKVTWEKYDGAAKCRLYVKNGSSWTKLTETSGTSFVHEGLKDGTTYTYTVRGLDDSGAFVTDFNRDGWTNTFIAPPVITSLTNTAEGVSVRWKQSKGAECYRVYLGGSSGWTALTDTTDTAYVDTNVQSGKDYKYTVRCISGDKKRFMSYFNSGKTTRYIAVPTITSITNTDGGSKLTMKKPAGAERLRVYYQKDGSWVKLTETTSDSYVHNKLTAGTNYTYTVRCVDGKGNFVSDFNRQGWNNTYLKPPVISSLTNTEKGVQVRWASQKGAVKYRVYVGGSSGWTALGDTTDTSYLATDVTSGTTYKFTVRCISEDSKRFTSYYNGGKSIKYVAMPKITAFENTASGTKITVTKPKGASKIRVYTKGDSGWAKIGETTSTTFMHNKLTNGKKYVYTVRCVDGSGNLVSAYSTTGWSNTFIAPPAAPTVTAASGGNQLKWKTTAGITSFRPFRKTFGASWGRLTDKVDGTSYLDTTAKANTLYAYTLRGLDSSGKVVTGYVDSKVYYYNGKLANGDITVGSNKLHFSDGVLRSGYQKIDGKTYYYDASGVLKKNGIVGSAADGYCYADKNGVIDFTYRNGVTYGGADWNVLDGKAYKVKTDKERTLFRALKLVYKITDRSMSKAEKLRKCFNYILTAGYTEKNPRIPHYTGMDWPIIYANDVFVNGVGNCISFAAAFGFMAKAIGYENVYGCHSGGHGWTEIDGRVYDPEWRMHHSGYSYYGMTYTEPCDVKYASGIAAGYAWMHIKI